MKYSTSLTVFAFVIIALLSISAAHAASLNSFELRGVVSTVVETGNSERVGACVSHGTGEICFDCQLSPPYWNGLSFEYLCDTVDEGDCVHALGSNQLLDSGYFHGRSAGMLFAKLPSIYCSF